MFETKQIDEDRYAIITKGFDHVSQCLVILIHEYSLSSRAHEVKFIKKIELCKT